MLIAATTLQRCTVMVQGAGWSITDLFLEPDSLRASHFALATGPALDAATLQVPFDLLDRPDTETLRVSLRPPGSAALETAPVWVPEGAAPKGAPAGANLSERFGRPARQRRSEAERLTVQRLRLGELLGLRVLGRDGVLGRLEDAVLNWDSRQIVQMVVDTGAVLPGRRLLVEISRFAPLKPGAGCLRANLTQSQLEQEPEISTIDDLDRSGAADACAPR